MAGSEKATRKEVEKEEEEKEEKSEAQKKSLVDKAQRTICEFPCVRKKKIWRKNAERGIRVPGRNNFWEDLEDGSSFS